MSTYIAMLRGINVSGHNIIKMELLREMFKALGFSNAQTYVQSGNVVFETGKGSTASLSGLIEKRILRDFRFTVPVVVKTSTEMAGVVSGNPFPKEKGVDEARLYVTFLSDTSQKNARELLLPLAAKDDRIHVNGREIYLYCPEGYGNTKISNNAIEKKLSVVATTRNWKTVNALLTMAK